MLYHRLRTGFAFVPLAALGLASTAGAQRLGPRVSATERLRLGVVDGPAALSFYQIRDARLGPEGTLVVLDGGDNVIKVFDRAGRLLRTLGRTGEGPAEFGSAWQIELSGDTLRVLDIDLRKIVTFALQDGRLLGTRRLGFSVTLHGFPVAFATRPDGSVVIAGVQGCGFPRRPSDNQWGVFVFGPDGAVTDTIERRFIHNALPAYTTGRQRACTVVPWPFAPGPSMAFDPAGGAYRSPGDAFVIERLDRSLTRVTETIAYSAPRLTVTGAHRREFRELLDERESSGRELRAAVEHAADSVGYPTVWPAITALEVAGPGVVWAQRGRPIRATEQEWDVLDSGRHVRTVVLPAAVRVMDVRGDRIIGTVTDELDVQYVVLFAL